MSAYPTHILLIESDPLISELMATVFTEEGYVVTACRSPEQALPLFDLGGFDLVITDGFSKVAEAIAAGTAEVIAKADLTPVALFTAHAVDVASAQAAGFRDLIVKPFDLTTVIEQVKALLTHEHTLPLATIT